MYEFSMFSLLLFSFFRHFGRVTRTPQLRKVNKTENMFNKCSRKEQTFDQTDAIQQIDCTFLCKTPR